MNVFYSQEFTENEHRSIHISEFVRFCELEGKKFPYTIHCTLLSIKYGYDIFLICSTSCNGKNEFKISVYATYLNVI